MTLTDESTQLGWTFSAYLACKGAIPISLDAQQTEGHQRHARAIEMPLLRLTTLWYYALIPGVGYLYGQDGPEIHRIPLPFANP